MTLKATKLFVAAVVVVLVASSQLGALLRTRVAVLELFNDDGMIVEDEGTGGKSQSQHRVVVVDTAAAKTKTKMTTTSTRPGSSGRSILFVHVGKSGGETLKRVLEVGCRSAANGAKRRSCLRDLQTRRRRRPSQLDRRVRGYAHCFQLYSLDSYDRRRQQQQLQSQQQHQRDDGNGNGNGDEFYDFALEPVRPDDDEALRLVKSSFASLLYNVRHPVDRVVSWYNYVSPQSCRRSADDLRATTATNAALSPSCRTKREIALLATNDAADSGYAGHNFSSSPWIAQFFKCFPRLTRYADMIVHVQRQQQQQQQSSSSSAAHAAAAGFVLSPCGKLALESLTMLLTTPNASTTTKKAKATLEENPLAAHLVANLQTSVREYYLQDGEESDDEGDWFDTSRVFDDRRRRRRPGPDVLTIRTEHFWDDVLSLESFLGSNDDDDETITPPTPTTAVMKANATATDVKIAFGSFIGSRVNEHKSIENGSNGKAVLSPKQYYAFCCVLRKEFAAYGTLVVRSSNLADAATDSTLRDALRKCNAPALAAQATNSSGGDGGGSSLPTVWNEFWESCG